MKALIKMTTYLLALCFFSVPLTANSEITTEELSYDRQDCGCRALSDSERLEIEKKCTIAHLKAMIDQLESCEPTFQDEEPVKRGCSTSHPGAVHHWIVRSGFYHELTLQDGSIWEVKRCDRHIIQDWYPSDDIVIYPNDSIFSDSQYNYKFHNETLGTSADVRLLVVPLYNGAYTRWITDIDYYNQKLTLNDHSIWSLSGWDQDKFDQWLVNDTVIIGCHKSFFSWNPNILINPKTKNHVHAKCEWYPNDSE